MSTFVIEQFQKAFSFIQQQVVNPCAWEYLAEATRERHDMLLQGYGTYVAVLRSYAPTLPLGIFVALCLSPQHGYCAISPLTSLMICRMANAGPAVCLVSG